MRVVIVTSVEQGLASRCLPGLLASPALEVAGVIQVDGPHPDRLRRWRRKARKLMQIGLGGAINGYRMRAWFEDRQAEPLAQVCQRLGVELIHTPYLNSPQTVASMARLQAELGLSLGNGFMAPAVYEAPTLGMINVHCERLPAYQNASSVIWPLFNGEHETGLTVHRIAREIDTGDILYQKKYPIEFRQTLSETVAATVARTYGEVPAAVRTVCEQYSALLASAQPQRGGARYTTPSLRQFRAMRRNHDRLREQAHGVGTNGKPAR